MFQELLPASFVEQAYRQAQVSQNNRVYTPLVVLWLLIVQRLHGGAPLQAAVLELLRGLPESFWPRPCKRIRDWRERGKPLSSHAGAYHQARQKLPLSVIEASCDRIFKELMARLSPGPDGEARQAFLLDGSSMRLAHSPALTERFPLHRNQNGETHWPVVRVLVAHDLYSGLAMRPEWGPMDGPDAVSEQGLLERALHRLPDGATVVGDANFGVFSVAYAAAQSSHSMLLRLTQARAQRLLGKALTEEVDRQIVWKPSRDDRRSHPELPEDASVPGRLIVCQVQPSNGAKSFLLSLFTTLEGTVEQILNLYGQRWHIETDVRTLKRDLSLQQLTCATPEMAAKEIEMGIATYNLVRAMLCLAAQQSGNSPRDYGFTKARRIVQIFAPQIATAGDREQADRIFQQMMHYLQQAKLPTRHRKRPSYPRGVWSRGERFPVRKDAKS